MTGRTSLYSAEIAESICHRLIEGETLRQICRDEAMPDRATVHRWLASNEAFRDQYTRARELQADNWFEEIVEIADDSSQDMIFTDEGEPRINSEFVQRSKLRVDARKWVAAKAVPKKYGDRITAEHVGKDGASLIVPTVVVKSDEADPDAG
jgi:hypothetical protein